MNTFDLSVEEILKIEGGLSDNPDDPGGITNFGISIRFAGSIGFDLDEDGDTDEDDIKALNIEGAKLIYFEHFWVKIHGDLLPRGLAHIVFDEAVNQGPRSAIKDLQYAVGATVDGIFGDQTRMESHRHYNENSINELCARRMDRYGRARNKAGAYLLPYFGLGWGRRLMRAHAFGLDLARKDGVI